MDWTEWINSCRPCFSCHSVCTASYLLDVFLLFLLQRQLNEDLLQLLIAVVDDELLKTVGLKNNNAHHMLRCRRLQLHCSVPVHYLSGKTWNTKPGVIPLAIKTFSLKLFPHPFQTRRGSYLPDKTLCVASSYPFFIFSGHWRKNPQRSKIKRMQIKGTRMQHNHPVNCFQNPPPPHLPQKAQKVSPPVH